ncbi:hypothetical protein [Streptomyces erythrochromogenes]|uniref:hypothetical protein n=1 Tax=Streptomyces erythrochromogenes TaxID=285574 RepID=UPI0033E7BD8B
MAAQDVARAGAGGFHVAPDDGTTAWARTVLLATGVIDVHPVGVEGFAECWGRTVIHCPFCVGWENADRTWALVADDPDHAATAATAAGAFDAWSADVIAITPPGMDRAAETRRVLRAAGSDLVEGEIARLQHRDGDLHAVELADGTLIGRRTLLWSLPQHQVPLVTRLTRSTCGGRARSLLPHDPPYASPTAGRGRVVPRGRPAPEADGSAASACRRSHVPGEFGRRSTAVAAGGALARVSGPPPVSDGAGRTGPRRRRPGPRTVPGRL